MLVVFGVFNDAVAFLVVLKTSIGTLHGAHLGHNAHDEQRHDGQSENAVEYIGNNLHISGDGVAVAKRLDGILLVEHTAKKDGPS